MLMEFSGHIYIDLQKLLRTAQILVTCCLEALEESSLLSARCTCIAGLDP